MGLLANNGRSERAELFHKEKNIIWDTDRDERIEKMCGGIRI